MGDEEELRARIEAQMASRRAADPPPKRDRPGRRGRRDEAQDTPQAPEVPRSLEPIRPWLLGQDKDEQLEQPEDSVVSSGDQVGASKTLGPARPWLARSLSEPADDAATPPGDRTGGSLQPIRPWLRRAKVEPAPSAVDDPQPVEQPAQRRGRPEPRPLSGSAPVESSPAPHTEPDSRGSWRERSQAKRELAASTAADLAGATPDDCAVQSLSVTDGADSVSRPAVVLQEHWARERESLIDERAALTAEREDLLAQRSALAELRETANGTPTGRHTEPPAEQAQAAQRKPWRPWRARPASAGEAAAANVLRPRHAAIVGQPAVELEHVSPFESYRTAEVLGTPAPAEPAVEPAAMSSAPAQNLTQAPIEPVGATPAAEGEQAEVHGAAEVDEDTPASWSRRTLNWLLAPAERPADLPPPDPASIEVDAAGQVPVERDGEDRIGAPERYGLPPWRLRPDVEPAATHPATEPEPTAEPEPPALPPWRLRPDVEPAAAHPATEPEPTPEPEQLPVASEVESDLGPEPEPAGDAPPVDPGSDLPRRLAAANAAAMERARNAAAYEFPEDDDHDDVPPSRRGISALALSSSGPRSGGIAREREEQPVKTSPLVTGKAFARNFPPAAPAELDDDGTGPAPAKRHRVTLRGAIRMVVVLAVAVLLAVLLRRYVVAPYYIPSASMEPTLHGCSGCNNDHVLVDKMSYKGHGIRRGDVVVFHRPKDWRVSEKVLIKRVIGLPGDTLTARNGIVYIDGLALDEPYLNRACQRGTSNFPKAPVVVPDGQTFVMGDNRCDSSDSRVFGPVPDSMVIGRAFMIIWPLGRLHWL
ncbi:MAG: signal peptidase I [Pseudonocardiales bacterium]